MNLDVVGVRLVKKRKIEYSKKFVHHMTLLKLLQMN